MNRMDACGHAAADVVVCSAEAYVRTIVSLGVEERRVRRIPWGIAPASLAAGSLGRRRPRHGLIGCVGRIEPRKQQVQVVLAAARLVRIMPELRVELVGPVADRVYADSVRDAIVGHGLERVVRLRGRVASVPSTVTRWDLLVSPSIDEGQGLAVLEAMALGVPVLARRVAGVEDYLAPGVTGLAMTGNGPAALASDIASALADREALSAMAGRARALVARQYDWAGTVDAIERVYAEAREASLAA
jgi:glycosyltransferase involved in cell wall biosynthesis